MRVDLLAALSAHLRTVTPETFDLKRWSCGTTACAIGHAVNVPLIAMNGLKLSHGLGFVGAPTPVFGDLFGWYAVENFFGLSTIESESLFSDWAYHANATASDVADRIDCLILEVA